jgi:ATP-binding cassette subfamily B protein
VAIREYEDAVGAIKAVLMLGRRIIAGRQALGVEFDMRNALYAKLVRLSFGFFDRHQTGQLMSRATVDLQAVRFFLGYGLIFFFQHIVTVVVVTSVLFIVDWQLALVALWITPILVFVAYRYSHVSHPVLREVQQKMADVATVSEENIVGVHVVKPSLRSRARRRFGARRSGFRRASGEPRPALYVPLISFVR